MFILTCFYTFNVILVYMKHLFFCHMDTIFSCKQKHLHKDKVPHEEEDAAKETAVRKAIKTAAAEVEQAEGRGQIKVKDKNLTAVFEKSDLT